MTGRPLFSAILFVVILLALATPAMAVEPHAGMLRYPDVSATHIVFLYANDLWLVPKEGGTALPLASPPGEERYPKFSPDGRVIAFSGNYDGNRDLYTIPVAGGTPFRVTHHPAFEAMSDWTPDGRLVFYAWGIGQYPRATELFTVSAEGGLPEKMPVPYGASAAVSPDGEWMAYNLFSRDHRTWKRYRGGAATDIWLFHLTRHTSTKITDWEGTDTRPMWHNDRVYYVSDEGSAHRLNIWVYDTKSGERRQVTDYKKYDVKWASIGPGSDGQGEIVFQYGSELRLLDLGTEKARTVSVTIPGDRPKIRAKTVQASELIFNGNISSTGKRAVIEARGDIWTLPAKKGSALNLHRSDSVAERDPAWSPDGQWICYFSDASGEGYELYITQSDGRSEPQKLTSLGKGFLYAPVWSPDSKWISFWDEKGKLYIHNIESKKTRTVDRSPGMGRSPVSWSSDSNWLAYSLSESQLLPSAIRLYNVDKDEKHKVTSGVFNDTWPTFDREGKYLFFASQRDFSSPIYEDYGTTWVYANTDRLYVVPLSSETESPFAPESDDEKWEDEEGEEDDKDKGGDKKKGEGTAEDESKAEGKKDKGEKDTGKKDDDEEESEDEKPEPVEIDLEGFERRTIPLPAEKGGFSRLCVNDEGKLLYARNPVGGEWDKPSSIHIFDMKEEKDEDKEKTVISGIRGFAMSGDGKKLLVMDRTQAMAIMDAKADQKMDPVISTSGMTVRVDPRNEWRQIFNEAWRVQRDFFYDPNMHGVDWDAVREQYAAMLEDCASREDVSYVIGEMIAELNVGHAYYWGGDTEHSPSVTVGMPGCDFELQNGAYRISKIIEGGIWDTDARGPLSQPGVGIKVGDYLLAVNGVPLDTSKDPWAAFQGLAGKTVSLTVSEEPKLGEKDRHVLVKLLDSDYDLRYRAWIEKNRAYVAEKTDGKVGYIYVPNTGIEGQNDLVRQFFGQVTREALIIDERWNGGGQIPTRFVELLNRPLANYWATRYGKEDFPWPPDAHHGPKCMLINSLAGSGGDYFPFWFREAGLGKLVGTRTWGGLVGMSGNPALIDGGYTSAPTFAFFEKDGTWGIEGHGVDPDIEVVDDPALMVGGKDPQLDAAIDLMLEEIDRNPYRPARRPPYPDRSGMGIREEDR
ncbi:MAG: PD40 domain-containing protein [Candidatus Eiseniibacteriota bacterium]|nr:MAG: PD40 domain-containing protein [Candidatus Eisenbacteria bacterium]